MTWVMLSHHVSYWLLFPKYEFINDDYYVYSYEWYWPGVQFAVFKKKN
jgi:hypothetical protein